MSLRHQLALLCLGAVASMGASYRTQNFIVEAPTPQIAQQIGQQAEYFRKEKAMQWLGQEMQPWPEPCPLQAKVTMSGAGGATSFAYDRGQVLSQHMQIEGSLDRLLQSVLPHEVTHTVFAYHFKHPTPRWADEGGAVLSEDDTERGRHDQLCRHLLNQGQAMPLRRLFALKEYPPDVMTLYAEGYSVTAYLVGVSNRQTFLNFIGQATSRNNWDEAVQTYYHYRSVEELEQAWLAYLRSTKNQPGQPPVQQGTQLASSTMTGQPEAQLTQRIVVRQTAPPVQPFDAVPQATFRGVSPEAGADDGRYTPNGHRAPVGPAAFQAAPPPSQMGDGWQPVPQPNQAPMVTLGTPPELRSPAAPPAWPGH
jgi:hypothetical protein